MRLTLYSQEVYKKWRKQNGARAENLYGVRSE